jgi:RHS repeat-associated protein
MVCERPRAPESGLFSGSGKEKRSANESFFAGIPVPPAGVFLFKKNAYGETPANFDLSRKELDQETGFYYYGARYLNPKTSMWISADPAMGEYIPSAPLDDEARKRNENLPGMGGVYNYVNFHVYHYAGNNPVKYTDPDGGVNIPATSYYVMNGITSPWRATAIKGDPDYTIGIGGCAITAAANLMTRMGFAQTPLDVNTTTYLNARGEVDWAAVGRAVTMTGYRANGKFTHAQWRKQERSVTDIYITLVNVNWGGGSDHWVGVEGIETIEGTDYLIVSHTSVNDLAVGRNSPRIRQGWVTKGGENTFPKILVPVDKIKGYVTFHANVYDF